MKKRGPKPSSDSVCRQGNRRTFYIKPDISDKLDKYVKENNMSISTIVNQALGEFIRPVNKTVNSYSIVSLFSGCGGMDLGFMGGFEFLKKKYQKHNFDIKFANDISNHACDEYKKNLGHNSVNQDICSFLDHLSSLPIDDRQFIFPEYADIVIGGFPCQDFSVAGKRKGLDAHRGRLYQQMKRVISMANPKIFVAENVKGLTNLGDAIDIIKEDFSNTGLHGYKIFSDLLHAANYGVPQTRERVFIVGIRNDLDASAFSFPHATHSPDSDSNLPNWVTSEEAIDDLKEQKDFPNQNQYSKARNYGEHCQGNKKIKRDFPGPTIRAEHHGNIEFHYELNRRLTIRECARIQSFPDNYIFHCSPSAAYKLIGNAVPPVLAWHIAESVEKALIHWGF
ncbi:DNA (cytosine-5-)-methyltransferase [Geovibrio sp. ADMFC3]